MRGNRNSSRQTAISYQLLGWLKADRRKPKAGIVRAIHGLSPGYSGERAGLGFIVVSVRLS
jgi:hypothetical protein